MTDLRYPIGPFEYRGMSGPEVRAVHLQQLEEAPAAMRRAVAGLGPEQLNTPYRPGGWTVRQLVHHVADSHLNSQVRFRWALTEEEPTIKAYFQDEWAKLPDASTADPELSLALLDAIHGRWLALLRELSDEDFQRVFHHPEVGRMTLDQALALYAWHGRHHVAHITALRQRESW